MNLVDIELDLFPDYLPSLSTGSIFKYGQDAMLILARGEDAFQLYSYQAERDDPLVVEEVISENGMYYHMNPFIGLFGEEERVLFSVFDSDKGNVTLYYVSGSLDDLEMVDVGIATQWMGYQLWDGDVYVFDEEKVLRLDLDGRPFVHEEIVVDGCTKPVQLRNIADTYLTLICANQTYYTRAINYDLFLWDGNEFVLQTVPFNQTFINQDTDLFVFFENLVYYSDLNGIWTTNFNG